MVYLICKVALEIIIYSRFLFVSKCSHAHLLDCILTDQIGLCMFSVIKNVLLEVVIINVETWTHLCLEWPSSHFKVLLTLGNVSGALPNTENVGSSHLKMFCLSSPGVSTVQPAIQLPGCLICSGNLLPLWGLDTLGTVQRPKQRHLESFGVLRTAKKSVW